MKLKNKKPIETQIEEDSEEVDSHEERPSRSRLSDSELETLYDEGQLKIVSQQNDFLLPQLTSLIMEKQIINLRPEYQRRLRWDNKKKSLLIESLLMNVPIPAVFLFESDLARYEVMDGQQRINAILEFFNNELRLTGLEIWPALNGKRYRDCPPRIRRGLERRSVSAVVLLHESQVHNDQRTVDVRQYVFKRLNTGGEKLNPQEIRNCVFSGTLNNLIVELSRNNLFARTIGIPPYSEKDEESWYIDPGRRNNSLFKTMGDCQLILRFFALRDPETIRGSIRSILDSYMMRNRNPDSRQVEGLRRDFTNTLALAHDIFGAATFRLPGSRANYRKVSRPLFDAVMVGLDSLTKKWDPIQRVRKKIAASFAEALSDPKEYEILVGRPNTAQSIKDRIHFARKLLAAHL